MNTSEIIEAKVTGTLDPIDGTSGFSDVFNGKRVSLYVYYYNKTVIVSIKGLAAKEFNYSNKNVSGEIIQYIVSQTK